MEIKEIEAISQKHKSAKIEGKWYPVEDKVLPYLQKGKMTLSIDNDKVVYALPLPESEKEQPKDNPFEAKDRRITRMACLNTATTIIEIAAKHLMGSFQNVGEQPKIDELSNLITEMTKQIAENLEGWVYRER